MKILFIINDLHYGGLSRQLTLLAGALPRDRYAVRIFTLGPDAPWSHALREAGIAVESGNWIRPVDPRPLLALRRAVRAAEPDVIHLFGPAALRALSVVRGRRGARVVLSGAARGGPVDNALIVGVVDRVAAWGPTEVEQYRRRGVPAAKLVEVPLGVPLVAPPKLPHAAWRRARGLPENARLIVGVGPLEGPRGFHDAIWAFDILQFLYEDLHLLLVGRGPEEDRLREFTQITRATGRVHFAGEIVDLDELLGHAEIAWVPSRADRGSLAALEAMAAGRPVIAARWPSLSAVVTDGETGILVPPGDKAALARETRLLLDDPDRRRRFGEAGRQRAAQQFSLDGMLAAHESLYATLR
jgi:glycosyltransferase involved in cell wall biosynthesis